MDTRQAYNKWSGQYDTNDNKTRDLEAKAFRAELSGLAFDKCLEIGCGTGKNTVWLVERAGSTLGVDLSEQMLQKAREKIRGDKVEFRQADILKTWDFGSEVYDLISFSLVLEHIDDLSPIFREASTALKKGGHVYIGELHPFKQYSGSKAKFDTDEGQHVVECYTHHISDFTRNAKAHGLNLVSINEYFDDEAKTAIPRILTIILKKA